MTKFFAVKSYERIWVQIVGKSLKTIPQHNLPNTPFYVSNTFRGLYNYCCIVRTDKTLLTVSILLELYKSPGWTDQYLHILRFVLSQIVWQRLGSGNVEKWASCISSSYRIVWLLSLSVLEFCIRYLVGDLFPFSFYSTPIQFPQ